MIPNYAISSFCFGDRYYKQTNRMIESFSEISEQPDIFVITDSPESIYKKNNVHIKHVNEFNSKYSSYKTDYYNFDFSVKRFSLLFAFDNGYNNVILTDTDVITNKNLYSTELVMNSFIENSISGQVTYLYENEKKIGSMLGRRFDYYEKKFNVFFDKKDLWMPEDCIQYISIDTDLFKKFFTIWDKCIEIKDKDKLPNIPAGNIDEMCFSALYNGISLKNNSNKSINLLTAIHDKWY